MNSLDAQLSFTFQQEWRRLCALFIQEITSLSLSLLSFLGLRGEGGGCRVGMEWALGLQGRNVDCCGIHAARVIVIHSYYTGNVCVERM